MKNIFTISVVYSKLIYIFVYRFKQLKQKSYGNANKRNFREINFKN